MYTAILTMTILSTGFASAQVYKGATVIARATVRSSTTVDKEMALTQCGNSGSDPLSTGMDGSNFGSDHSKDGPWLQSTCGGYGKGRGIAIKLTNMKTGCFTNAYLNDRIWQNDGDGKPTWSGNSDSTKNPVSQGGGYHQVDISTSVLESLCGSGGGIDAVKVEPA